MRQSSRFPLLPTAGLAALCLALLPGPTAAKEDEAGVHDCAPPQTDRASKFRNIAGNPVDGHLAFDFLRERMQEADIPALSLAIVSQGELVFSAALGQADINTGRAASPCTIFEGASITKPLFAHFAMTFVNEGALELDRPLFEYLPLAELAQDPRHRLLTARMVLTHRTGLPNWREDLPDGKLRFLFEPGTDFGYSGEAFQYLALVLQHIAGVDGRGLQQLFAERILLPLGMNETAIIPDAQLLGRKATGYRDGQEAPAWRYDGEFGAAYGVNTTAQDFARWLAALVNDENLSPQAREALFTLQPAQPRTTDEGAVAAFGNPEMALGFFSYDVPGFGRIFMHDGNNEGFSSIFIIHPESRWGIVMLANRNRATQIMLEFALFVNSPG